MSRTTPPLVVHTVGHSNHSFDVLLGLLRQAEITAVADVRSVPVSRFLPQFNRPEFKAALEAVGIRYSFLGAELGGRPKDPGCYRNGVADYRLMAETALFQAGIERLLKGARTFSIAMMCAEKEPLDCHRTLLVARALVGRGVEVRHLLADGRIERHRDTERRLLKLTGMESIDLFAPANTDPLMLAYTKRGNEIAWVETTDAESRSIAL